MFSRKAHTTRRECPTSRRCRREASNSRRLWAAHWYGAVHRSTGFEAEETPPALSGDYARLAEAAWPFYEQLAAHRLRADGERTGQG